MRRCIRLFQHANPIKPTQEQVTSVHEAIYPRHQIGRDSYKDFIKKSGIFQSVKGIDQIRLIAKDIAPKLEVQIEKEVLENLKEQVDPREIQMLEQSWKLRDKITQDMTKDVLPPEVFAQEEEILELGATVEEVFIKENDLNALTWQDIGKYVQVSRDQAAVLFRNGYFGEFLLDEYLRNKQFHVMLPEEAIKLISLLKTLSNPNNMIGEEQAADQQETPSPFEQLSYGITNNPVVYLAIRQVTKQHLNTVIDNSDSRKLQRIFNNSAELFELLQYIMIYELQNPILYQKIIGNSSLETVDELRALLADSDPYKTMAQELITQTIDHIPDPDSYGHVSFDKFLEHLCDRFTVLNCTIELDKYTTKREHPAHIKDLCESWGDNIVLTGFKGNGKSQILTACALWGHSNNWVVIKVPRAADFTSSQTPVLWHPSGLYIQPEVAYDLLMDIHTSNTHLLSQIPVNKSLYGKYNIAGLHQVYDQEYLPLPAQRVWLEKEQVWSDEWQNIYDADELSDIMQTVREITMAPRYSRFEYEIKHIHDTSTCPEFEHLQNNPPANNVKEEDLFPMTTRSKKKMPKQKVRMSKELSNFSERIPRMIQPKDLYTHNTKYSDFEKGEIPSSLAQKLPEPSTLADIVEYGLQNHIYCTNAICELMEQLYHTDKAQVLVLVDQYNALFAKTTYQSHRYINYAQCGGFVPPYDMALGRLFMRMDGHRIRNGMKIMAASEKGKCKTSFSLDKIGLSKRFEYEIQPLKLNDFRRVCKYYLLTDWVKEKFSEFDVQRTYMNSQGNWHAAQQLLKAYHSDFFLNRT